MLNTGQYERMRAAVGEIYRASISATGPLPPGPLPSGLPHSIPDNPSNMIASFGGSTSDSDETNSFHETTAMTQLKSFDGDSVFPPTPSPADMPRQLDSLSLSQRSYRLVIAIDYGTTFTGEQSLYVWIVPLRREL